jgi:Ca2+:H+ antiporter
MSQRNAMKKIGNFLSKNPLAVALLVLPVVISALVSSDGESSWLEGSALLAVYLILGLSFFLLH